MKWAAVPRPGDCTREPGNFPLIAYQPAVQRSWGVVPWWNSKNS